MTGNPYQPPQSSATPDPAEPQPDQERMPAGPIVVAVLLVLVTLVVLSIRI